MNRTVTRDEWVFGAAAVTMGVGVLGMALFPLAIPIVALTAVVVLPLALPLLGLAVIVASLTAAWRGIRSAGRPRRPARPARPRHPAALTRARASQGCA